MSFLLRTKSDYRLCYGKPVKRVVITSSGAFFCANEFQQMVEEEKDIECHTVMESENYPVDLWADVCENNHGIILSSDVADYLLNGRTIDVDTFLEI